MKSKYRIPYETQSINTMYRASPDPRCRDACSDESYRTETLPDLTLKDQVRQKDIRRRTGLDDIIEPIRIRER